jgi:hypothetical protein
MYLYIGSVFKAQDLTVVSRCGLAEEISLG